MDAARLALVAVLCLWSGQAKGSCVWDPPEHLFTIPFDGAEDVPTDAKLWVLHGSDSLEKTVVELDGLELQGSKVGYAWRAYALPSLEPGRTYEYTVTVCPEGCPDVYSFGPHTFTAGSTVAGKPEPPTLSDATVEPNRGVEEEDIPPGSCLQQIMIQDCFDTGQNALYRFQLDVDQNTSHYAALVTDAMVPVHLSTTACPLQYISTCDGFDQWGEGECRSSLCLDVVAYNIAGEASEPTELCWDFGSPESGPGGCSVDGGATPSSLAVLLFSLALWCSLLRRRRRPWHDGSVVVMLALMFVGCLESNPQPSPVTAVDTVEADMATMSDGSSPPADAGAETACAPDCSGKECGPDGCNGLCGTCEDGQYCEAGGCYWLMCSPGGDPWCDGDKLMACSDEGWHKYVEEDCSLTGQVCFEGACCAPTCQDEDGITFECGDAGCGGSCGDCPSAPEWLSEDNLCVCVPDCWGKDCGPNGCGGTCGQCEPYGTCCGGVCLACFCTCCNDVCCDDGEFCVDGECGCPEDCTGYPCDGDFTGGCCDPCGLDLECGEGTCLPIVCEPDCTDKECGDDGCGGDCGPCPEGEECDEGECEVPCTPDCQGKECGDEDGCGSICLCGDAGGTCWPCATSDDCQEGFQCYGGGWGGSRCHLHTADEADCPEGTWWHDNTELCLSIGPCMCSPEAVIVGAKSPCTHTNDYGTCEGFVVCTEVGAPPDWCDAPEATPELCNGLDDNCDGETDEDCGQCLDHVCADVVCTEDCDDPGCEVDCCDGSCFVCGEGGTCIDGACCMPQCDGKACGPDDCGGSCGKCPDWHECLQGQCVVDEPCGVQFEGQIGCEGCACQECVCETDPYCCDHPWDAICVYHCILGCGGCGPCAPNCPGKECGSDGCGGSCGPCPPGAPYCVDGACEAACTPDCSGKECGPDGCGGSCGTCPDLEVQASWATMIQACGQDGQCHCARCDYGFDELWGCEADCEIMFCIPDCTGKECGPDGCAGICGQCGWGAECGPSGQCVCALP